MDTYTEQALLQNINSILKDKRRTSVFVAHRLRTIYDSDQILVLKDGQVALVTGASSGLGERFAETLAAHGARVAVAARRTDRLAALVARIHDAGGTATAIKLDVADAHDIPAAIDRAAADLGAPVQILVNNAGIGVTRPSVSLGLEDIDAMLNVNLRAPYLLAREVARRLIDAGLPGRIVKLSSIGAFVHEDRVPSAFYSITKTAMARMAEVLAVEWARHHINVNAIAPGFFRSEMSGPLIEARGEEIAARLPRGRFGEPRQLDSTLLYLVSPESEFVTGTCIKVDDGQMSR